MIFCSPTTAIEKKKQKNRFKYYNAIISFTAHHADHLSTYAYTYILIADNSIYHHN